MTGTLIGMVEQDRSERDKYEEELKRIMNACEEAGVLLRVIGSLAFQIHCPKYGYLQAAMGRGYTDIDFAAYNRQTKEVRALLTKLGYRENQEVYIVSQGERAIYERSEIGIHIDVFYDRLSFCHVIYWNGRLEIDKPSIPLAEMLLEKMQIVKINEKDVVDSIMLLLEHRLGDTDQETINIKLISGLCSTDWGLWRTVTMNLEKVRQLSRGYVQLSQEDKECINSRIGMALARIEREPKSMAWRLRARVGDRVKWYKDVDDVQGC